MRTVCYLCLCSAGCWRLTVGGRSEAHTAAWKENRCIRGESNILTEVVESFAKTVLKIDCKIFIKTVLKICCITVLEIDREIFIKTILKICCKIVVESDGKIFIKTKSILKIGWIASFLTSKLDLRNGGSK